MDRQVAESMGRKVLWGAIIVVMIMIGLSIKAFANEYPATYLDVYDGDTFKASVDTFPNIQYHGAIRINGIDTPEIRTKSACEKALGYKARDALDNLLHSGKVIISNVHNGKYSGRVLADVYVNGRSAAKYMLDHGYARPYAGGPRDRSWCGVR